MTTQPPKETISQIIAKSKGLLKSAQHSFGGGFYDDAISRAYYGVYHAITAILLTKGLSFSSHGQTIGAFNREFDKIGLLPKNSGEIVRHLFEARQSSDYDALSNVDKADAEQDLKDADMIITECETYLKKVMS